MHTTCGRGITIVNSACVQAINDCASLGTSITNALQETRSRRVVASCVYGAGS